MPSPESAAYSAVAAQVIPVLLLAVFAMPLVAQPRSPGQRRRALFAVRLLGPGARQYSDLAGIPLGRVVIWLLSLFAVAFLGLLYTLA